VSDARGDRSLTPLDMGVFAHAFFVRLGASEHTPRTVDENFPSVLFLPATPGGDSFLWQVGCGWSVGKSRHEMGVVGFDFVGTAHPGCCCRALAYAASMRVPLGCSISMRWEGVIHPPVDCLTAACSFCFGFGFRLSCCLGKFG